MKIVAILTATGLAAASFLVLADPGAPGGGHRGQLLERIKAADTDGNGMLSRQEAAALPMIAKHFDQIAATHDGQVTMEDLRAFHQQRRAAAMAEHFKRLDT